MTVLLYLISSTMFRASGQNSSGKVDEATCGTTPTEKRSSHGKATQRPAKDQVGWSCLGVGQAYYQWLLEIILEMFLGLQKLASGRLAPEKLHKYKWMNPLLEWISHRINFRLSRRSKIIIFLSCGLRLDRRFSYSKVRSISCWWEYMS